MILSKSQLVENILAEISDNSTGQISPYDIRHNLLDIIDSVHLLTLNNNLKSLNFDTFASRSTKAGESTLEHLGLEGYFSVDNSAFGYAALKSNYQGERNTAVGSQSLGCNLYGSDNNALGFNSLAGNTTGFANVGVGNFSLHNNKSGSFNIAIGHGAGYYVERDTNYKFILASHPIDSDYICANPLGSGLIPLLYGDLSLVKLGIGVSGLHGEGILQTAGSITPSKNSLYDLGSSNYSWENLYLNKAIALSGSRIESNGSGISISGNLLPILNTNNVGSLSQPWHDGYFYNLSVSNLATINNLVTLQKSEFTNKTLFLASNKVVSIIDGGGASGIDNYATIDNIDYTNSARLDDSGLLDAGLIILSSGLNYNRQYKFTFLPPDSGVSYDSNSFAKATWNSNISVRLDPSGYLISNRLASHDPSGQGIYFQNGNVYIGRKNILDANPSSSSGLLAGLGNVNFISNSGSISNYISTIASPESGVTVSTRFLTGIKKRVKDTGNQNKDRLNGFELKFIDDSLTNISNIPSDRFIIESYNNTSSPVNAVVLSKANNAGILGINNFGSNASNLLPQTSLDIRSTGNAIIRSTSENQFNTRASLELFGQQNCEYKGFAIDYLNLSGIADIAMYKDSGRQVYFRLYDTGNIGLFTSSGNANEMFTLGDNFRNRPVISMYEASGTVSATAKYGKLVVRPKIVTNQAGTLNLVDGSGNIHDLVVNKFDVNDARAVYTDASNNTFAGKLTPKSRTNTSITNNTALGSYCLHDVTTGSNNISIGNFSLSGITTGYQNIFISNNAGNKSLASYKNIVIGNNIFNNTSGTLNNNIVIGYDNLGNNLNTNHNFLLGSSSNSILLQGKLGPTNNDKNLTMPNGGKLYINDNTNADSLLLKANTIEVVDNGGNNYPDNELKFKFTGVQTADLLTLSHNANPLNITPSYAQPSQPRPHAELKGDLRLLGSIRFNDNTSLSSSSFLNSVDIALSGVNRLSSLIVEGYVDSEISAPADSSQPTVGTIISKNAAWQNSTNYNIVNRDTTLKIHNGAYVIAINVNNEYRPLWVSSSDTSCKCCGN